jgi:hypothetical protein
VAEVIVEEELRKFMRLISDYGDTVLKKYQVKINFEVFMGGSLLHYIHAAGLHSFLVKSRKSVGH